MDDDTRPAPGELLLTKSEREQVSDILSRRAQEIATFKGDMEKFFSTNINGFPGSVELALTRETTRLRRLRDKIKPIEQETEDGE